MERSEQNTRDFAPATAVARLRVGKLCVAIQAGSPVELIERAEAALSDSKFLEFRLDSLPRPLMVLGKVKEFLAEHRDVTVIATCRRKPFGGSFNGSLTEEMEALEKAAQAGCQIVDLAVESAEEAKPAQLEKFRDELRQAGAALLVSFHDFSRTHELDLAAKRIEAFAPEFVKVVSTAQSLADNLAVLKLIEERSLSDRVVGIAMGEEGIVSRVLGMRAGGTFTFASLDGGEETAPGQVSARTLRDLTAWSNWTRQRASMAWPGILLPTRSLPSCRTPPSAARA
jgi:3-dehydroquinate dehydratase/shikimate dehydrogenase